MEGLGNSLGLGRFLLTLFAVCEHVQLMSFGKRILGEGEDHWQDSAGDIFDGMKKIALRFEDHGLIAVYILSVVFSLSFLTFYLIFTNKVHVWNRQSGLLAYLILAIDHIIFGLGFVPMIAAFAEMQLCNSDGNLASYNAQDCWDSSQMALLSFGFIGASAVLVMSAVVSPLLRDERGGLEKRWGNEDYFPALFRLLTAGIIYVPAGIHKPFPGIAGCSVVILYLCWSQAYKDNHIAAVKMGVLCGQLWVFISAQIVVSSGSELGSQMLIGWAPAIVVGYALQWAIWYLIRKKASNEDTSAKQD